MKKLKIEEAKKEGEYKLPMKIRMQQKRLAKRNKILVLYLRTNRSSIYKICEIKNGMVVVDGNKIHQASMDFVYLHQGRTPMMVVPEWSLTPIGTKDYYDAVRDKKIADPQTIIIRAMEMAEVITAKKVNKMALVWIVIAVAIVGYIFFGGK